MNRHDWQNAFGPAPDDFRARVDETLNRLEERDMRRRTKFAATMIAAVLAAALLAGAAFAVSRLDIWESLNYALPIVPLESADELVATDLAAAGNEYFRVCVQEGVYDGFGAIVKLRFEPEDPEKYVILSSFADPHDVGEGYITEVVKEYEDGIVDERIVGREDGKEIIWLSTPQLLNDGEPDNAESMGFETMFNSYRDKYNDDGSAEFWITGMFANDLPETLNVRLKVRGMDAEYNTAYGEIDSLPFSLVKLNHERTVQLAPTGANSINGFELVNAQINFTEVRGYISVEYTGSATDDDQGVGISLRLLDAEGKEFNTGSGYCTELENGHYLWGMEMQSFEEIPETMVIEAHVIGESAIGKIECRVEQIEG